MRPGVVFDVDGTLIDTNHLHVISWWRAFRSRGRVVPMFELHRLIGLGAKELVEEVLGHYEEDVDATYSDRYHDLAGEITALPAATDLITELHGRGVAVVLATSAKAEDVARMLETIQAGDRIAEVVSSGDADHSKPSPEIFQLALERADLDRTRSFVVGDTVWDGRAAVAAGLPFIGVLTGGIPAEDLREAGAIEVYDTLATLLAKLQDSPLAKILSRPA